MPSAVELLPCVRGTLKMQARGDVGPVKTCAEEKLEWIARYLGGTLGRSVIVQ